jgi:putative hydrolase of HD superfamily
MTNDPTIQRIAELQQLIADFSRVERAVQLADTKRPENDVDHSFGLALTCWFLAPKIAPELDLEKIFAYALSHDIVEIHSGDTYIFGSKDEVESKNDREDAAIAELQKSWPDFSEITDAAAGYKAKRDEEAKFVYAVDKILPILMVNLGEKEKFWERQRVTFDMMKENKRLTITASPIVAPYFDRLVEWLKDPNYFYDPAKSASQQR